MTNGRRWALLACLALPLAAADAPEQKMLAYLDSHIAESNTFLEQLVNINSGTLNPAGVRKVADVLRPAFESLGFKLRWIPMDEVHRAGHLVAERDGVHGKRVLLIGHMDTVFEPSSPFQTYTARNENSASGPGAEDMKGGLVIMLYSLRAMQAAGVLDGARITVFLTGDEERPGEPYSIARRDLIAAARQNDVALEYEAGARTTASIARRSSSGWTLKTTGRTGHSAGIFGNSTGDGAIYELARILSAFHDQLREPDLTYNVGIVAGGATASYDPKTSTATASGKANIVPATATATGDIRTIDDEQLRRVREKMKQIAAQHLNGAGAEIEFHDGYPSMPATPGNQKILDELNAVNRDLGFPTMTPLPPASRGAGDLSFAGPYLDALSGMGALGSGSHAPGEVIDLKSQPMQMKRSAVLLYRLTK